jgi:hypothetical protein
MVVDTLASTCISTKRNSEKSLANIRDAVMQVNNKYIPSSYEETLNNDTLNERILLQYISMGCFMKKSINKLTISCINFINIFLLLEL